MEEHSDVFSEATQVAARRSVEFAPAVASAFTAMSRRRQRRRQRSARTREAERAAARAEWAPAHDPAWLAQADLVAVGRVWAAAVPYADGRSPDFQPAAAAAMRKVEGRMRDLHPYAMARYDRLRGDGADPITAMREAAPLFDRHPYAREAGPATSRHALAAGRGWQLGADRPTRQAFEDAQQTEAHLRRGRGLIAEIDRNRPRPVGSAQLRAVLEARTSLPPGAIDELISERERRSAADLAALDVPYSIDEVVATAQAAPTPTVPTPTVQTMRPAETARRTGRSGP